jgi:hypothetical protein
MRSIEVSRDRLRGPLSSLRQMNKRCVAMRVSECDRSQHNPARPRHRRDVHRRGARGGRPARHGKNADHVRRARCEFDGKHRCEGQKGHTKLVVGCGSKAAVGARSPDVGFFPDSGGIADIPQPPFGANSRLPLDASSSAASQSGANRRPPDACNCPIVLRDGLPTEL